MNNKSLIIMLVICSISVVLLGVFIVKSAKTPNSAIVGNPKVEVLGDSTHSWGDIDIEGGNVEKVFQIKNTGDADLQVNNFKTSCMCTETQINISGEDSPVFGMHTKSSWQGAIKPGETADVTVVFDPLFHGPQGTGPITRLVSFDTNDSSNRTVEFRLSGNVVRLEN